MNQSINTDSKNSKEPQQKYRLGTVSIKILVNNYLSIASKGTFDVSLLFECSSLEEQLFPGFS